MLSDFEIGVLVFVVVIVVLVVGLAIAVRKWWLQRRLARRLVIADDQADAGNDAMPMVAPMVPDSAV